MTRLLGRDGLRCCLGFVGQAYGYADEELLLRVIPTAARAPYTTRWPSWMLAKDAMGMQAISQATSRAMDINDDNEITEEVREVRLAELFAQHGTTLQFVD